MTVLGTAPTTSSTRWPSLKNSSLGIDMIPYRLASSGSSSTFTFKTLTRPAYSSASASTWGAIILQGPHQTAQKSTSTGTDDCRTCSSKSLEVTAAALLIVSNLRIRNSSFAFWDSLLLRTDERGSSWRDGEACRQKTGSYRRDGTRPVSCLPCRPHRLRLDVNPHLAR